MEVHAQGMTVDGNVAATLDVALPVAPATDTASTSNRLKASIVDLTFVIWAVAIPVAFGGRLLNSDGDLARHITMGEYMLRNGRIERDVFSFTRGGEPFVAYEWMSQITYALMHRLGGLAGITVIAGLILAATYALVVLFMRNRGVDPLLTYLTGITAALLGAAHWLARPHLFTLLALSLLLFFLEPGNRRRLLVLAPFFIFWANLHPGFVVGLMLLAVVLAGDLAEVCFGKDREAWLGRAKYHAGALLIGLLASLVNPRGIGLHLHIQSLLSNQYLMGMTNEFTSPTFHGIHGKIFLLTLLVIVTALALSRARPTYPRLFLLLFTIAAALIARRNIPVFAVIALPLLALEFDHLWRRLSVRGLNHVKRVFQEGEALGRPGLLVMPVTVPMLVVALLHGSVGGVALIEDEFDRGVFPVAAVEYARQAELQGRIFNAYTWGGYILYAWPEQKIFIDGMSDFFGEQLVREYVKIMALEPGWDRELEKHGISLALIPVQSGLAYAMERSGWERLYADGTAVVLRRPAGVS